MPITSECVINCRESYTPLHEGLESPSKCKLTNKAIATMSTCPKKLKKTNLIKDSNKGSLADHPYLKHGTNRKDELVYHSFEHGKRKWKIHRGF